MHVLPWSQSVLVTPASGWFACCGRFTTTMVAKEGEGGGGLLSGEARLPTESR